MRNFVVTIDGKQYQVGVEEVGAGESAPVTPVVSEVKPVAAAPKAVAAAPANGTKVNAPMPGLIKALSLAEGATVKKGDVILVLEAMKMENAITSDFAGTVKQILVRQGQTVATDAVLMEIE